MIEIYLKVDQMDQRTSIISMANEFSGELSCEEERKSPVSNGICLTFEFESEDKANTAIRHFQHLDFHAEGPYAY